MVGYLHVWVTIPDRMRSFPSLALHILPSLLIERFCVGYHTHTLTQRDLAVLAPSSCMGLLPCELVIARYNDCAHRDSAVLVGDLLERDELLQRVEARRGREEV